MKQIINKILINPKELALLSLIQARALGSCDYLMGETQVKQVLETKRYLGEYLPAPHCFAPDEGRNPGLAGCEYASSVELFCNGAKVGTIEHASTFCNHKNYTNIFNANVCLIGEELNPCIAGEIHIKNNPFKSLRRELAARVEANKARRITALVLNADPITRAHERMLRWTIDKADLVLVFVVDSAEEGSLDFEIKKATFLEYAKNFLPMERIFPIYLQHVDLFSPYVDPNYECLLARSFGANKFVIGQNHPGVGLFFSDFHAHTAIDQLSENSGLELIVLPEFAFCTQCGVMVSTKSCPHGAHHHIKYRSHMIRQMLRAGLIPPTVLVRREISAKLLAHLHPNRFNDVQRLYDGLFPSEGIIENRSDEDLYKELIRLYQINLVI